MLRAAGQAMRLHQRRHPVKLIIRAGEPADGRRARGEAEGRIERRAPVLARGCVVFWIRSAAEPPRVAELQTARAEHRRADLDPRVHARHQRRVKTAPRTPAHADAVAVHLRPRFEIRHRLQQRDRPVINGRALRLRPGLQRRRDGIPARRAITRQWKINAQRRIPALRPEHRPVTRPPPQPALIPDKRRQPAFPRRMAEVREDVHALLPIHLRVKHHLLRDNPILLVALRRPRLERRGENFLQIENRVRLGSRKRGQPGRTRPEKQSEQQAAPAQRHEVGDHCPTG